MSKLKGNLKVIFGIAAGFILGSTTAVIANQTIQAIQNTEVSVCLDGEFQTFRDASTNEIQYPITYHDRTYLPLRNIADLMDIDVDYDAKNNIVILGESPEEVEKGEILEFIDKMSNIVGKDENDASLLGSIFFAWYDSIERIDNENVILLKGAKIFEVVDEITSQKINKPFAGSYVLTENDTKALKKDYSNVYEFDLFSKYAYLYNPKTDEYCLAFGDAGDTINYIKINKITKENDGKIVCECSLWDLGIDGNLASWDVYDVDYEDLVKDLEKMSKPSYRFTITIEENKNYTHSKYKVVDYKKGAESDFDIYKFLEANYEHAEWDY